MSRKKKLTKSRLQNKIALFDWLQQNSESLGRVSASEAVRAATRSLGFAPDYGEIRSLATAVGVTFSSYSKATWSGARAADKPAAPPVKARPNATPPLPFAEADPLVAAVERLIDGMRVLRLVVEGRAAEPAAVDTAAVVRELLRTAPPLAIDATARTPRGK